MKVSIITACFNGVRTIEQTMRSVLEQTYKNIEYIVIDGGSTDGTRRVIEKYRDRLACFVSEPDAGVFDAMNKGIQCATGEIIGLINSDDYYVPDAVERVVARFSETGADVVHGDFIFLSEDGKVLQRSCPLDMPPEKSKYMATHCHPTVFVRAQLYRARGLFSEKYKIVGDFELLLRFEKAGASFAYLPGDIAYYRTGGLSDTKRMWRCMTELRAAAIENIADASAAERATYLPLIERHYAGNRRRALSLYLEKRAARSFAAQMRQKLAEALGYRSTAIVFGAGVAGLECARWLLRAGIALLCFVDNDLRKQGAVLIDRTVHAPAVLAQAHEEAMILVAVRGAFPAIRHQLEGLGIAAARFAEFDALRGALLRRYVKERLPGVLEAPAHRWSNEALQEIVS